MVISPSPHYIVIQGNPARRNDGGIRLGYMVETNNTGGYSTSSHISVLAFDPRESEK